MRGEKVFLKTLANTDYKPSAPLNSKSSWAARAANGNYNAEKKTTQKLPIRPTPPQRQIQEDRRVIVCLKNDHESRKTETFLLSQKI